VSTSEALADETIALAASLSDRASAGHVCVLSRFAGGRNNQVYRVETDTGVPLVLKRYFSDPRDGRDRLSAEWNFLERAWRDGVRAIPQPLAKDADEDAALYSFVPGRKLAAKELGARHVDAAADFILAINAHSHSGIDSASDACFSISDHLQLVERRLLRLAALDPQAPCAAEAQRIVFMTLRPSWDAVRDRTMREAIALGLDLHRPFTEAERCLSPSDFGFHNALASDDRLVFLDFEYFGWDDPVKLVADFLLHPGMTLDAPCRSHFKAGASELYAADAAFAARLALFAPLYVLRWILILLNEFLPERMALRRASGITGARATILAEQLAKAAAMLYNPVPMEL